MSPIRLLLGLSLAIAAAAQPASDLLQSGIYAQETLGDLDAAIHIYRQILTAGVKLRLYSGQAQYRLGICLQRKGDLAGAAKAFETVVKLYPDQRELAARARENLPSDNSLLPSPWSKTEVSEYRWSIPRVSDGWSISRIAESATAPRTLHLQMIFYNPGLNVTMIDADRETMLPLSATLRQPSGQDSHTPGFAGGFQFKPSVSKGSASYLYGELPYVLRRTPLSLGWNSDFPLVATESLVPGVPLTTLGGALPVGVPNSLAGTTPFFEFRSALHVAVAGIERVVVPAGTFQCYKVRLTADAKIRPPSYSSIGLSWPRPPEGETFWYAVDGARPLVKIQSGNAFGELTSLRTGDPKGTSTFRDSQVGYSLSVPAGWIYHARAAVSGEGTSLDLIDPDSQTLIVVSAHSVPMQADRIEAALRAGAEAAEPKDSSDPQRSSTMRTLGGHPALTVIQRDPRPGQGIAYTTWVQSESTRASIRCQVRTVKLDVFLHRLQPILDSFRMP
jgi:hypothetical protein